MSGLAYGDIVHAKGPFGHWIGMVLRPTGPMGVFGTPVWSLLVIVDEEGMWNAGEIKTIEERTALDLLTTPTPNP